MRRITTSLSFLFALANLAFAQVLPDSAQLQAWKNFNVSYQNHWIVRWDKETGTPASIYGYKTSPYISLNTPEAMARQFLQDYRAIFKMKAALSNLVVLRSLEDNGVNHIDFQEIYQGIPILGAEYSIAIGSDKAVQMAGGKYFPDIAAPTKPVIAVDQAITAALTLLKIDRSRLRESSSRLVIVPSEGRFFLAHRLWLNQWEVMVNAITGTVESHAERIPHIDGTGNVYPKDPVNSSLTTVTIPRLLGAGDKLDGTYIKATNNESGDAVSSSRDFRYNPPSYTQHDGTHLDDANVYYHVDKFAYGYWPNIGYSIGFKVQASVHDPYPYGHDNAVGDANTLTLRFGHGVTDFWDLAKKEDVIYHEFTHIVSGVIGLGYSGETAAMNEGYSDYHAATFTNDPRIGEWVTRNYSDLRTLATSAATFNYSHYNQVSYTINSAGGPHANGMIWSGALWDLRNALGSGTTDFLAYKGLVYRHGTNTTFLDGREGVIITDQNYYGSTHVVTIENTFAARGIGSAHNMVVSISGETSLACMAFGFYSANVTDYHGNLTYEWTDQVDGESPQMIGTGPSVLITGRCDGKGRWLDVVVRDALTGDQVGSSIRVESSGFKMAANDFTSATEIAIPKEFVVAQNFPNPFNPETAIRFGLPQDEHVQLLIIDLLGREVRKLADNDFSAGYHLVVWDGKDNAGNVVPSGVYIYQIVAGTFQERKKLVLVR